MVGRTTLVIVDKLEPETAEEKMLRKSRNKRIRCYNEFVAGEDSPLRKQLLETLADNNLVHWKKRVLKTLLKRMHKIAAMRFKDWEHEHRTIEKPERAGWSNDLLYAAFPGDDDDGYDANTTEQNNLIHDILEGYGCFEY